MSQPRWRVVAASVRGAGHDKAGLPCQDAHQWAALPGGLLLVAVADGAGSAPLAEVGAALAVRAAAESASRQLNALPLAEQSEAQAWERVLTRTVEDARAAVVAEAAARSVAGSDLATTLIVVVAGPDAVGAVQVGDGAVVVEEAGAALVCISRPPPGEYLNETTFLTSAEAVGSARPTVWRGRLGHLAVISDGLQMAALRMPASEPHPGFFNPLFRFVDEQTEAGVAEAALASFLASPRLRERTDDDVTLVLASAIG